MTKNKASNESTSGGSEKRSVIFDLHSTYAEDSKELIEVAFWSNQVTTPGKIKAVKFIPDTDIPKQFSVESVTFKTASTGIAAAMGIAGEITLVLKSLDDEEIRVTLSKFTQTFDDRSRDGIRTVTIRSSVDVKKGEDDEARQTAEE